MRMIEQSKQNQDPSEIDLSRQRSVSVPSPQIIQTRLERIDNLSPEELASLTQFPASAAAALGQHPKSLPISSYPELFTRQHLDEFKERVESVVGPIDLQMGVARADIQNLAGVVHYNHPVHVFSSFSYKGNRVAGSFLGSVSNSILVYGTQFPNAIRQRLIEDLVSGFCDEGKFAAVSIAFPQRMVQNSANGALAPAPHSASAEILSGEKLGFSSFNMLPPGYSPTPQVLSSQLYYFRGPTEWLEDPYFLNILREIRRVRTEQLDELRRSPAFEAIQRARNEIARECVAHLIGQLDT